MQQRLMEFFIKELITKGVSEHAHRYFTRFGKGTYRRRFLVKFSRGKTVKIRASFELANEFVGFVRKHAPHATFSGNVLSQTAIAGKTGRKKGGSYAYEVTESDLREFEHAYYYLVNTTTHDITLKIKKAIPKPGKDAEKIDDVFCALDVSPALWNVFKNELFWDVSDDATKVSIEHDVNITEIILPPGEKDPVKLRANAKRKGTLARRIDADGETKTTQHAFVA